MDALIGNLPAKRCLQRMLREESVAPTLLFFGPEGVGKSLFALKLAAALMGKEQAHAHPDLHIYRPEGKSGMHSISSIRAWIDEMPMPPFEAPCKVFILQDAERMLESGSNALLKTLEEPAPNTFIILISSDPKALLPTILSRCRKIPFIPISSEEMIPFIQTKWNKTEEEAKKIAFLAGGSLGKASILAEEWKDSKRQLLVDVLNEEHYPTLLKKLVQLEEALAPAEEEETSQVWMKQIDALFDQILMWYRDLHLINREGPLPYLFYHDHLEDLRAAKRKNLPPLEKIFEWISEAHLAVRHHVKLRTALECLLLNCTSLSVR